MVGKVKTDGGDLAGMWGYGGSMGEDVQWHDLDNSWKDKYFSIYMEELGEDKYGDHMALFPDKFTTEYPQGAKTPEQAFGGWNSFTENKEE